MAVKIIWPITHSCGHQARRDLSDRAAGRRAGFATVLPMRLFEQRARCSSRQDLRRAKARSPGARRPTWSRLHCW